MKISRQVTDRIRLGDRITASIRTHAKEVGARLETLLEPHLAAGETMPDFRLVLLLFARLLAARQRTMQKGDDTNAVRRGSLGLPRKRRDRARDKLYAWLIDLRRLLDGIVGRKGTFFLLGLRGRVPQSAERLLAAARTTLSLLRRENLVLPPARWPEEEARLRPTAWAEELEPMVRELETALKSIKTGGELGAASQIDKDRGVHAFDRIGVEVTALAAACYRLAGYEEYARRLGPGHVESRRRRRQRRAAAAPGKEAAK